MAAQLARFRRHFDVVVKIEKKAGFLLKCPPLLYCIINRLKVGRLCIGGCMLETSRELIALQILIAFMI